MNITREQFIRGFNALDKTVAERQLEGSAAFSYSLAAVLR